MARTVTSENARINRRCETALKALSPRECDARAALRASNACAHVQWGTRLDKHAKRVLKRHGTSCPALRFDGFHGTRRRRRRR
jgi:hypothetical protein